jgi:hypothetical protein
LTRTFRRGDAAGMHVALLALGLLWIVGPIGALMVGWRMGSGTPYEGPPE